MKSKIINYVRAGYPGLYLVSAEEQRVESELKAIAQEIGFSLYSWSTTTGLLNTATTSSKPAILWNCSWPSPNCPRNPCCCSGTSTCFSKIPTRS